MARIDEEIKEDVIGQICWDDRVDASQVTVLVGNGIVTLGGSVSTSSARNAVLRDARIIYGVVDVINKITIRYPSSIKREHGDKMVKKLD